MQTIFKKEYKKALVRPTISDHIGSQIFESTLQECTIESVNEFYKRADNGRLGTLSDQHESAYIYLALAFVILEHVEVHIKVAGNTIQHYKLFHAAGHAFREIGQMNRAADAYWRSGVTSNGGNSPTDFGIRSIAHAKICFGEIGEEKKSENMHCLEWDVRRHKSILNQLNIFLYLWHISSRYGTSFIRWFICIVVVVIGSTIVYEFMHDWCWIHQGQTWTPWVSALYYCIVTMTTLGYGEFVPSHPISQTFVVFNVLIGYFLLSVGITIIARKVVGR